MSKIKTSSQSSHQNLQWISRKGLACLLVIQIFVIAPHFLYVPFWLAGLWVICAFWRWKVFQGAWSFPSGLIKTTLVGATSVALLLSFGVSFSFQTMTSLLIVGFCLKLIEMKSARDYLWVVFIGLFIVAGQFIEYSEMTSALYGGFCLSLLCVALMQLEPNEQSFWKQWKKSWVILVQAIPLMLLFFVVFPRLGAFWSVPSAQHGKTGMSDSMSPGDFSNLMQSNELAFRVKFDGKVPPNKDLYWRSLVFSQFDGRRWSPSESPRIFGKQNRYKTNMADVKFLGRSVSYEIIAEPTNNTWLFALAAPQVWSSEVFYQSDMRLAAYAPLSQAINYKVTSQLDYEFLSRSNGDRFGSNDLEINRQLPVGSNPRAINFLKKLQLESSSQEELIKKIFDLYHSDFYYTSRPPRLGENVVDEFLFQTHQGFCEHFASSFVFLMRAAGIPARVVVGYQGGTLNPVDNVLSVRQRDAHAWAEVWMGDGESVGKKGWVMFDPTAAVAPERVEIGIESALSENDQAYLAQPFGNSIKVFAWARSQMEALNFQWTHWVLNYDSNLQMQILSRWMTRTSPLAIVLWLLGAIGAVLGIILLWLVLQSKPKSKNELEVFYNALCAKLKPMGFLPLAGEAPSTFFLRVGQHPRLKEPASALATAFNEFAYGGRQEHKSLVQQRFTELQNAIRSLSARQ